MLDATAADALSAAAAARFASTVDRMLRGQAYRELGAARLFEAGQALAPDAATRRLIAAHAAEERAHYRAVLAVWAAFAGGDPADAAARAEAHLADNPLPTARSWPELAMAQFLFDRAGLWQLREYQTCRYVPYRALVARILDDEATHQDHGAETLLALGPGDGAVFTRWLSEALRSFGRPGSDGDRFAVVTGLKRRPAAAVMQDFLDDLKPTMKRLGLRFPAPLALALELPPTLNWAPA
jgi:1,2-phenylacetyl-CoA epoxidase catalytic subunit